MDSIVEVKNSAVQQVYFLSDKILLIFFDLFFLSANFDEKTVDKLPPPICDSVYYGWAKLLTGDDNHIYKMVTSVGTNPFYHGERKTMVIF